MCSYSIPFQCEAPPIPLNKTTSASASNLVAVHGAIKFKKKFKIRIIFPSTRFLYNIMFENVKIRHHFI